MKSDYDLQIRATARKQFYKSAIQALQQISSHSNPISKLAALADTFTEIETVSLLLLHLYLSSYSIFLQWSLGYFMESFKQRNEYNSTINPISCLG